MCYVSLEAAIIFSRRARCRGVLDLSLKTISDVFLSFLSESSIVPELLTRTIEEGTSFFHMVNVRSTKINSIISPKNGGCSIIRRLYSDCQFEKLRFFDNRISHFRKNVTPNFSCFYEIKNTLKRISTIFYKSILSFLKTYNIKSNKNI